MRKLFSAVGRGISKLTGSLSWTPPPWAAALNRLRRNRPAGFWGGLALLVVLLGGATAGYIYYLLLPRPLMLTAEIEPPGLTANVENPQPEPLRITFDYDRSRPEPRQPIPAQPPSVARIDLVNQPVKTGIHLEPEMAGSWSWQGDRTLVFVPGREWPAGTRFSVSFDKALFVPEARFSSLSYDFSSPPFTVEIGDLAFYQNPKDRKVRQAVATLRFSHPVDRKSLEKHLSMTMRPSGAGINVQPGEVGFTVTYDKNQREAYVHSTPLQLPEHSNYLQLAVAGGVAPAFGGTPAAKALSRQLLIPDRFSFLKVEGASAGIVRDPKNEPQQILTLRFSDDITEAELKDKLRVWLLPPGNPRRNGRRWQSPREVNRDVLDQALPLALSPLETEHGFAREFHLPFDVPPNSILYVRLEPGLTSLGDFVQASFYDTLVSAPDYPREIKIAAEGAVLSLSGTHRLGLMARGLEAFQVRIGKLLPGQLQHLISQTSGDIRDPYFENYRFSADNIVAYANQVIDLKPMHPKKANYASVDLSAYLPGGNDRFGLFFVEVCGWDKVHSRRLGGIKDKRLILVTDLGLLVKDNADRSHELFVQSLATGRPVADARVTLEGRNGEALLTRFSDRDGHVHFPNTGGFENEHQPNVYVVRTAGDIAFIPFERPSRKLNFSRFEVGGATDQPGHGQRLNAYLFSDRGLYRPGETAAIGCIVKSEPLGNIEGIPLEIAIQSPRGNEVANRRLSLPPKGFFDYTYTSQPASETGTYQVALYLVRDGKYRDRMIGSTTFRVEEFQPDTMKIQSVLEGVSDKGWSTAGRLTARVKLTNLFGTPAQGRKVTARMNVHGANFSFKEYRGFTFADPWYDPHKQPLQVNEALDAQTTGTDGRVAFKLPLDRFAQGTYLLTLTTEGFEPGGGRGVKACNSVLLSPMQTLVGTKSDGSLDYINKDAERFINLIAIGPDLKARAVSGLHARLVEIRTISTLVQQPNGTYAYQSVEKERELRVDDFAIPAEGIRHRLPTARPGTFLWELLDPQGLKLARIRFNVVGHGNLLGKLEKNAELELKLNHHDYKAGDTIEMNITAPYTGSGLITIESDRVQAWKWFSTDTTSTMETIAIPDGLEGNAYVNVAFVRAPGSREIFTSPLSYAVAPFTIDRSRRTLDLDLAVAARTRPGEPLEIAYATSRPARIAVFAVNEGILQVAGYKTPQPLDYFLRKRALQVDTLQMLDLILPEFDLIREVSASGGGMDAERMRAALAANLNPFARALDRPAVFWSGILDADGQRRTVSFTPPDTFAGTLRVMAVAVAEDAIGVAQSSCLVRGPFVITPSLPTQVSPGDSFRVSAGISNILEGSGRDVPVSVRLEPSEQLEIIGNRQQKLTISEGSEKTVHFQLKAKDRLGAATLRFEVTAGSEQARRTVSLSVRPAVPFSTTLTSGYESSGKVGLDVPRPLYADLADQQVAASASPLVLIAGLTAYLEHFPHGCTEQLISQVFPMIGLAGDPAFAPYAAGSQKRFAVLIARLRERQVADGGFSLWPGGSRAAEFPTVYAMHFLLDARELGYAVPNDLMTRGRAYLRAIAGTTPSGLEQARVRAYAVYLLTRMGDVTTNHLVGLQTWLEKHRPDTWRQDLAAAYMAAAYALLQKQDDADDLIRRYRLGTGTNAADGVFYAPLARDAQFVYLLARHFPDRAAALDGNEMLRLVEPVFRGRYNTISAAYTILALGAYGRLQVPDGKPETIHFTAIDAAGRQHALKAAPRLLPQAAFGIDTAKIKLSGDQPLFYLLSQAGFDHRLPAAAIRQGLEISRDFLDHDGQPITRCQQGQEVSVRLRVRALDAPVDNVAVIDLLPGGFEVLRDSVPRTAFGWQADYVDVREDRVVFYGSFDTHVRELTYRAKVTGAGDFVMPPPWAEAMYDRAVRAAGTSGRITVTPSQ